MVKENNHTPIKLRLRIPADGSVDLGEFRDSLEIQLADTYIIIGGDGREYGPKTLTKVRRWIREGRLDAESPIKEQNNNRWKPLGSLQKFVDDLAAAL